MGKKVIGIIAIIIVLLAAVYYGYSQSNKSNDIFRQDSYSPSFSGDNQYNEHSDNRTSIHTCTGIMISRDFTSKDFDTSNDKQNKYNEIIQVYLNDGTLIYESGLISPGCISENKTFKNITRPGIYQGVAVYSFYDIETNAFVNMCEVPIEINYFDIG